MGVLTEQFIQECLDRQDSDVSKLILKIAQGANATEALLARASRSDIIEWLGNEIEVLVDELAVENAAGERNNAQDRIEALKAYSPSP